MDTAVYVNGREAARCPYGYSTFTADITRLLCAGENVVSVRVRHESPNTRWYSGAGIFRNVHLITAPALHVPAEGLYIHTSGTDGRISVQAEVQNFKTEADHACLQLAVYSPDGQIVASTEQALSLPAGQTVSASAQMAVSSPLLWDLDMPNIYRLRAELVRDGAAVDVAESVFGFKDAVFDPDKGFWLNGRPVKLHGVCMHHDLGSLGAAFNPYALERQMRIMKEMGVNAIRTSHNPPAPELMDICDRMGLLVVSEAFDMWERAKTGKDYARFFKEWAHTDVTRWVRRDRNHPSLLMWSIGNEIYDTHVSPHGREIAENLKAWVRESDPLENGMVTVGSNYMRWENAQKTAEILDCVGYNYAEDLYDGHHAQYPGWRIYGSETASAVRSRGIYHFPADASILTHPDQQCSSLDNSVVSWGSSAVHAWTEDRNRPFVGGQFIWTGFDYIGEPTPYNTKNSYFGIVDTAGFPKDIYYFYQSAWTGKPMLHLFPYWDWNEGQEIPVTIYTNAPKTELFLNGRSLGTQEIDHAAGDRPFAQFTVPYEKGVLTARGYDANGNLIAEARRSSFGNPAAIILSPEQERIPADGRALAFVAISMQDADGEPVENARNRVSVSVTGAGRLVGLDNGDSTDYDSYKGTSRRLFSGKLLAVIQSNGTAGEICLRVSSEGLPDAEIRLYAEPAVIPEGISVVCTPPVENGYSEIPVRRVELSFEKGSATLTPDAPDAVVCAKFLPANSSYRELTWRAVMDAGEDTYIAVLEPEGDRVRVCGRGDGHFRLQACCNNGSAFPQLMADREFTITGMGEATRNPYEKINAVGYSAASQPFGFESGGCLSCPDNSYVVYSMLDFGENGCGPEMTIYTGNNADHPQEVEIWEGTPDQDGRKIMVFEAPSDGGWNSANPYRCVLPENLQGIKTLSFVFKKWMIFGGFSFTPAASRALQQNAAADCRAVYGDDYRMEERDGRRIVAGIGNNVVLTFKDFDFGTEGVDQVTVRGWTPNPLNTIQLRCERETGQEISLLEFTGTEAMTEQTFAIRPISGKCTIHFVFLPGSAFDFDWFRFS